MSSMGTILYRDVVHGMALHHPSVCPPRRPFGGVSCGGVPRAQGHAVWLASPPPTGIQTKEIRGLLHADHSTWAPRRLQASGVGLQPLCGVRNVKRTGEVVALQGMTAGSAGGLGVGGGFDAFGHDVEVEHGGQVADGLDHGHRV